MSETTITPTAFVAYEYTTVRVPREMESVYRDSYRNFGWFSDGYDSAAPRATSVALRFKRDRQIKNRPLVLELQRKNDSALTSIAAMERSKTVSALSAAVSIGIVGCALLAGSIFTLEADLLLLSIPLGALGLLGWLAGYLTHGRVKAKRTARLNPLIDEQYDMVYQTAEQANHLLS